MNKLIKTLFTLLFPFYPILAWLVYSYTHKSVDFFISILMLPFALYFLVFINKKLPKYLLFFIIFSIYHLYSVFINNTFPKNTNRVYFLLSDPNVLACLYFIVIEYTFFDEKFISRMTKGIFLIAIISLIVSLIQIKNINFFFNSSIDAELNYIGENRISSIYSWTNLNSVGITFPILISILVSIYSTKKLILPIVFFCGIIVAFLTRGRYIMISTIIVFSQLFFSKKNSIASRLSILGFFLLCIFFMTLVAPKLGYDINEVIDNRILEKENDMGSAKARVLSYDVFVMVFPEHPWFGVGPETKKDVIDLLLGEAPLIHVGYLSYLYFYGIVGCLVFFCAIFFLLKDAWQVGKRHSFWGSFYGLLAFCFANTTMVYFQLSEMGIVLSIIYLRYYKHKSTLTSNKVFFTNSTYSRQKISPSTNF